jgi:hypothetical protein
MKKVKSIPETISGKDKSMFKYLEELGITSVEELDRSVRSRVALKILAVQAKGYMTAEDLKIIKVGMRLIKTRNEKPT